MGVAAGVAGSGGVSPEGIVVTGGFGTLGTALAEWLPEAQRLTRQTCDVTSEVSVRGALAHYMPEVVIHAAAITDHACADAAKLIDVNIEGTRRVARWCRAHGARFVYLSTHYVYPGDIGGYREWDATRPIGAYAASKLAGEAWAETVPEALVVRGSWYDYETRLKHWIARGALTDAWVSREPVREAARKIAKLAQAGVSGVYNIGGLRRSFAQILRDEGYPLFPEVTRAHLDRLGVNAYPFPRDVSVSTARFDDLARRLGWEDCLPARPQ